MCGPGVLSRDAKRASLMVSLDLHHVLPTKQASSNYVHNNAEDKKEQIATTTCDAAAPIDDNVEEIKSSTSTICTASETAPKTKGRGRICFPYKLHVMLDRVEEDGLASIVSWQPHGRCFVVHEKEKFVSDILPKYFRQNKWASFQRQLNLYGFSRLTQGHDAGGYFHWSFTRGTSARQFSRGMARIKVKGTRIRSKSNPAAEPNFYSMKPLHAPPAVCAPSTPAAAALMDDSQVHVHVDCRRAKGVEPAAARCTSSKATPPTPAEAPPCPVVASVLNGMVNNGRLSEIEGDSVQNLISMEEQESVSANVKNVLDEFLDEKVTSSLDSFFGSFDGEELDELLKDDDGLGRLLDSVVE